ncbi:hypothetical protein L195_g029028, partial [Trifolium pratense]
VRLRHKRLQSPTVTAVQFVWLPSLKRRASRSFVVRAAGSSVEGRASGSRRVYRESQANASLSVASVKQIATSVAPFGVLLAFTLGIQFIAKFFRVL